MCSACVYLGCRVQESPRVLPCGSVVARLRSYHSKADIQQYAEGSLQRDVKSDESRCALMEFDISSVIAVVPKAWSPSSGTFLPTPPPVCSSINLPHCTTMRVRDASSFFIDSAMLSRSIRKHALRRQLRTTSTRCLRRHPRRPPPPLQLLREAVHQARGIGAHERLSRLSDLSDIS